MKLIAGLAAAAVVAAALPAAVDGGATATTVETGVRAVATGRELVKTIAITRRRQARPRVVMSLPPAKLGTVDPGDRLHLATEVQVTLTCFEPGLPRCIGRTYDYSPEAGARLVLAPSPRMAGGERAFTVAGRRSLRCSAHRPYRNHHCVLVFDDVAARVPGRSSLPCEPDECFLNLVLDAHDRRAEGGDRLIIGADRPNGTIAQHHGRLGVVVVPLGSATGTHRIRSHRLRHRRLPEHQNGGARVVYSVRVPNLADGDALVATARQVTDIGALPYDAYVADRIVLARRPGATTPGRGRARPGGRGYITASNGFNCTQGSSHYETPCRSRKAGVISIRHVPTASSGRPRPLYVNLVSRSKPKHVGDRGGGGLSARLRRGGFLAVSVYRSSSSRAKTSSNSRR